MSASVGIQHLAERAERAERRKVSIPSIGIGIVEVGG